MHFSCSELADELIEAICQGLARRPIGLFARKRQADAVHFLDPVLEHRAVDLLQDVAIDVHDEVG